MKNKKRHNTTTQVTAETQGRTAFIRIIDRIGEWQSASSRSLRDQVDELTQNGVDHAEVYINSRGGDVFEAVEIVNELSRFKTVQVKVGAIAASAATYIMSKFPTAVNTNSQIMIHRPVIYTSGDVNRIESDLKLLKNTTSDYLKAYATKTGKTEEQIDELWAKGDYWMTAQEAYDQKFADEILEDAAAVDAESVALLEACGAPHIPAKENQSLNKLSEMNRDKMISALGLAADATDEQIEARAKQLRLKAGSYDTLMEKNKEQAAARAKALVEAAIKEKKISNEEAESYETMAITDYDFVAGVLAKLGVIPQLSAEINRTSGGSAPRADWTMQDYLDKDPEALQELYETDPEMAQELEKVYFK